MRIPVGQKPNTENKRLQSRTRTKGGVDAATVSAAAPAPTTSVVPNPGHPTATARGCTCAIMDNHYGAGQPAKDGSRNFWISGDCPIHAPPPRPAAAPAPRKLAATLVGAVLGASLMASPAGAQTVERECKTDRWTVEQYPVATCPPQGNVYLRGGSYGG